MSILEEDIKRYKAYHILVCGAASRRESSEREYYLNLKEAYEDLIYSMENLQRLTEQVD